ncbi:hypothetical protein GLYMA_07G113700v4 [Glycine max]|uniref:Uncharacterized protein n=1 Tax=Glycine max TaxID=3847 RepID=A0A0R0J8B6_SOYBN|nr:hypothetical protein JHK86_018252 [Glycine max]KAH1086397.1 hypothetical protein GYH30_018077 [Glycine max]KRH48808.1 hypothetical protein GLYMA_07G113700v4 [Glycine max]
MPPIQTTHRNHSFLFSRQAPHFPSQSPSQPQTETHHFPHKAKPPHSASQISGLVSDVQALRLYGPKRRDRRRWWRSGRHGRSRRCRRQRQ